MEALATYAGGYSLVEGFFWTYITLRVVSSQGIGLPATVLSAGVLPSGQTCVLFLIFMYYSFPPCNQ